MFSIISMLFYLLSAGSLIAGLNMLYFHSAVFLELNLYSVNSVPISGTFLFDWMSCFFMGFVLFISATVVMYSMSYMGHDMNANRFILIVAAFVFTMMLMITSPNLISILLGWDGLGLVSYALVIYYQNSKSSAAGMLTALSNRIGDVCFLLSIAWWMSLGDFSFLPFIQWNLFDNSSYLVLSTILILAAMTKSAQIPFSAWLPAAMAAPTPVSALVHSSTLVTAGVYLLIRFFPLIFNSKMLEILMYLSTLTMFMAGLAALYEYDLKKIIALSTLSQLGVMMFSLSLGFPVLAFFHLLMHALFKALLFLCAGVFIHQVGGTQDIRVMGGLSFSFPLTGAYFNMANLALCGMPFLAGFYSKDAIIESAMMSSLNSFILALVVISTALTAVYTFRLIYFSMLKLPALGCLTSLYEDKSMFNPMFFLGLGGIMGGTVFSWMLFPLPSLTVLPTLIKLTALLCGFVGVLISMILVNFAYSCNLNSFYFLKFLTAGMWFLPLISGNGLGKNALVMGLSTQRILDQSWLEKLGALGIWEKFNLSSLYSLSQKNFLKSAALFFSVISALVIIYMI
uniref:NADH-ubiquinone oxidoreductase chain 5 n=1 Tax=Triops longicaudatus TaxID=58777 RepID=Q6DVM5_9CRUS|nr:NADH dehydrogenase subunit 5 [Triops longicaudatus]AAT69274.1 NADH dehydrogenase subunit 5 [Triops longicaudatus]